MLRARRSRRVTIKTSPDRRKSSTVRNSSRPAVVVPLRFSERIKSQRVSILRDWTAPALGTTTKVPYRPSVLMMPLRGSA